MPTKKINMLGRELPEYVRKQRGESIRGQEGYESLREKMYERILYDAKIVEQMLARIDAFSEETPPEEVVRVLEEEREKVFADAPEGYIDSLREWLDLNHEMDQYLNRKAEEEDFDEDEDKDEDDSDYDDEEEDPEYEELSLKIDEIYGEISQEARFQTFHEVEEWTNTMIVAAKEVGDLGRDPEKALQALNESFKTKLLGDEDVVGVHFEPFCVQFEITPQALGRIAPECPDVAGCYFPKTHFAFISHEKKRGKNATERTKEIIPQERRRGSTERHESGHRMLDATHVESASPAESVKLAMKLYVQARGESVSFYEGEARETMRDAVEKTQDEFLAELNVVRMLSADMPSTWSWTTAERRAEDFYKNIQENLKKVKEKNPKLGEELDVMAKEVKPRFKAAKAFVLEALRIADFMEEKRSEVQRYITALAFVMPMRSYKHMHNMLERVYGKELIAEAQDEERLRECERGVRIPSLKEMGDLLARRKEDKGEIDWLNLFFVSEVVLEAWQITSLAKLKECLMTMKTTWPERLLQDPENSPMQVIARMFFSEQIDSIWETGNPSQPVDPKEFINDQDIQRAFLLALYISFDTELYKEDLSVFLKKPEEEITREDVLASPMHEFCGKAGIEDSFLDLVNKFLPENKRKA